MKFEFPIELPISQKILEISQALNQYQVLIIAGDTGSGKSTQLPKLCLQMGYGKNKPIAHTQPRRIAATALATRIAQECEVNLGEQIGYKIRFSSRVSHHSQSSQSSQSSQNSQNNLNKTQLILMTDGILLAELEQDFLLRKYNLIIIDEAHERSLNIDFLLGCLKNILKKRRDLKIIITSATLDLERFSEFFNQAPIIKIEGRTYPVETRYRPLLDDVNNSNNLNNSNSREAKSLADGVLEAVKDLDHEFKKRGDILVFLPTERDIHEVEEVLNKANLFNTEILLLFARLNMQAQQKIFQVSSTHRRIILSTNVAETSITVPNIFYVIDSGLVRIKRYNPRSKVERLPIESISQASANQREGRCGRIAPGVCIRLYSQEDFMSRSHFTDPEILRSNLASVILKMKILKLEEIEHFDFLERPENNLIKDGFLLLEELEAIEPNFDRKLTKIGHELAKYPVDPRLGRILIAGKEYKVLDFILMIVSALAVQDPRIRPMEAQTKADQAHKKYAHPSSDFLSFIVLYKILENEKNNLSKNKFLEYLNQNFISPMRYKEWMSVYQELKNSFEFFSSEKVEKLEELEKDLDKKSLLIHRALLTGLLGHIGNLELDLKKEIKKDFNKKEAKKDKIYKGARGVSFQLFPGSTLGKKTPAWIAAYELVETHKTYARVITEVNPDEIERAASHLVKKQYFEPHWLKEGFVAAFEKISLYGLEIIPKRRVNFSRVDVKAAREFFIRGCLVDGDLSERLEKELERDLDFLFENKNLKQELLEFEQQQRTSGLVIDDEACFEFFNKLIPEDIAEIIKFKKYYLSLNNLEKNKFLYTREFLLAYTPVLNTPYPEKIKMGGAELAFSYHFEPGSEADGVTLEVPLALLNQINLNLTSYLVPPLLKERIENLIKTLPKNKRLACSPAGAYAQVLFDVLKNKVEQEKDFKEKVGLINFMAQEFSRIIKIKIDPEDFQENLIPSYLRMNFRLRDLDKNSDKNPDKNPDKNIISESRDLKNLTQNFQDKAEQATQVLHQKEFQSREGITSWDFGCLEEKIESEKQGVKYTAYPALIDQKILENKDSIKIQALSSLEKAYEESEKGLLRLLILNLPKEVNVLRKKVAGIESFIFNLKSIFNKNTNKILEINNYLDGFVSRVFIQVFNLFDFKNNLKNHPEYFPRSAQAFDLMILNKRGELLIFGVKFLVLLNNILGLYKEIKDNLEIKNNKKISWSEGLKQDLENQLELLIYPDFIVHTPMRFLERYPIYLKAVLYRLEKYQEIKDKELRAELNQVWGKYLANPEIPITAEIHYLIEELRVSLFAQHLKAEKGVSVKKLLNYF